MVIIIIDNDTNNTNKNMLTRLLAFVHIHVIAVSNNSPIVVWKEL